MPQFALAPAFLPTRKAAGFLALIGLLGLSACGDITDFRRPAPNRGGTVNTQPVQPVTPVAPTTPVATQGAAETACAAAGGERGFNVQSVVGSSDVTSASGAVESRDVMLRVARGAQVFDLRCNYHYPSQQARVMAL